MVGIGYLVDSSNKLHLSVTLSAYAAVVFHHQSGQPDCRGVDTDSLSWGFGVFYSGLATACCRSGHLYNTGSTDYPQTLVKYVWPLHPTCLSLIPVVQVLAALGSGYMHVSEEASLVCK